MADISEHDRFEAVSRTEDPDLSPRLLASDAGTSVVTWSRVESRENPLPMSNEPPRYSTMEFEDCEVFYREVVQPRMRTDGLDPDTESPPYAWMSEHYRGFIAHLSRNFDRSLGDFYDDIGVPPEPEVEEGPFAFVEDSPTRVALEAYLEELHDRQRRATSTIDTRRSILRQYTKAYAQAVGGDDLLSGLDDAQTSSAEKDRVADTFDVLRQREGTLTTHASKLKYVGEVRQFYRHQVDFGDAVYDPTARLERRFGWDSTPEWDNAALSAEQIRSIYAAATTTADHLLVVAVCGWGLRPSEVAALHVRQLTVRPGEDDPEGPEPYLEFREGERKNGPGTVAILTGRDTTIEHVTALEDEENGWNGYLFPSSSSRTGHVVAGTVRNRFRRLAADAGVTVDGAVPTPKMGRRYWYTAYGQAVKRVVERFEDIADEQGSSSAEVVLDNYLAKHEKRRHRRSEMRRDLNRLFEAVDPSHPEE